MKVKKVVNIAGKILTVLALALIVRRLLMMDVDYSVILRGNNIFWILLLTFLYGLHIDAIPFAWMVILELTTGRRLPFLVVQNVFCKSNLLKYIPGNIFQYVGRNEIAVLYDLRHSQVALSTVLDIVANVLGVFIVAAICYAAGFDLVIETVRAYLNWPVAVAAAVVICAVALLVYKKRDVFFAKTKALLTRKNMARYGLCVAHYMFYAVYTGLIYFFILSGILHVSLDWQAAFVVVGAYLLSWLMGFLLPGSPGGIGVREAAILALLSPYVESEPVLLAIIIYRVVNTIGDVWGYLGNIAVRHFRRAEDA